MESLLIFFTAEWLIYLVIAGALILAMLLWALKSALKLGLILLVADVTANVLKYVFNTPRPAEAVAYFIYDPAFPSGHTAILAALGAVVFSKNKFLGIIILGLALVVGLARVLSGIHFLSDVAGGFVIGGLVGFTLSKWLKV